MQSATVLGAEAWALKPSSFATLSRSCAVEAALRHHCLLRWAICHLRRTCLLVVSSLRCPDHQLTWLLSATASRDHHRLAHQVFPSALFLPSNDNKLILKIGQTLRAPMVVDQLDLQPSLCQTLIVLALQTCSDPLIGRLCQADCPSPTSLELSVLQSLCSDLDLEKTSCFERQTRPRQQPTLCAWLPVHSRASEHKAERVNSRA